MKYLKILSRADSLIANDDVRNVILENKTANIKSLKYYHFVLFPGKIFKVNCREEGNTEY